MAIATFESVSFERPTNSTADTAIFALRVSEHTPPIERLSKFTYSGIDGQAVVKHGADAETVKITGWAEGSSAANLATAKASLSALAKDPVASALVIHGGETIDNAICTDCRFSRHWGHDGRLCADFDMTFESTG